MDNRFQLLIELFQVRIKLLYEQQLNNQNTDEDNIKFIINIVLRDQQQELSNLIKSFWNVDQRGDNVQWIPLQLLYKNFSERYKYIYFMNDGAVQVYNNTLNIKWNLEAMDQDPQNVRQLYYQVIYEVKGEEQLQYVKYAKFMNDFFKTFLENDAKNLYIDSQRLLNDQETTILESQLNKNAISVQACCDFLAISDFELMKAMFIAHIVQMFVKQCDIFLEESFIANIQMYALLIAKTLQKYYNNKQNNSISQIRINSDLFFARGNAGMSEREQIMLRQDLGIIQIDRSKQLVGEQNTVFFAPYNSELIKKNLRGLFFSHSSCLIDQEYQPLVHFLINNSIQAEHVNNQQLAVFGSLINLDLQLCITKAIIQQNSRYIKQLATQKINITSIDNMLSIVSLIFQVPRTSDEDVSNLLTQDQVEAINDYNSRIYTNFSPLDLEENRAKLILEQLFSSLALSRFYTLSFTIKYANFNQLIDRNYIQINISSIIIKRLQQLAERYQGEWADDQYEQALLISSMHLGFIKRMNVRPIFTFKEPIGSDQIDLIKQQAFIQPEQQNIQPEISEIMSKTLQFQFYRSERNVNKQIGKKKDIDAEIELDKQAIQAKKQQMKEQRQIKKQQQQQQQILLKKQQEEAIKLQQQYDEQFNKSQQIMQQQDERISQKLKRQSKVIRKQQIHQDEEDTDEQSIIQKDKLTQQQRLQIEKDEINLERRRKQFQEQDEEEYQDIIPDSKRQKKQALIQQIDYRAENLLNDIDIKDKHTSCIPRCYINLIIRYNIQLDQNQVDIQLQQIHDVINNLQAERNISIQSIDYQGDFQLALQQNYLYNGEIIIYLSNRHIFIGTKQRLQQIASKYSFQQIQNHILFGFKLEVHEHSSYKIYRVQNIIQQYYNRVVSTKQNFKYSKFNLNMRKCNLFFDFETTFDDTQIRFINKGVKIINDNSTVHEQIDFAISIVIDVKIKFKQIILDLQSEFNININNNQLQDVIIYKEIAEWNIPASQILFDYCDKIQNIIADQIIIYNQCLEQMHEMHNKIIIKEYLITNDIFLYSYNGSKFDNQFILNYIKDIDALWYKNVQITGSLSDIKILKYNNLCFLDIRLMTGGASLKQFCKDFKLEDKFHKIDFDINKLKTLSEAIKNKDEIMKYVLNDSLAIYRIYKLFRQQLAQIITDFISKTTKKNELIIVDGKFEDKTKYPYEKLLKKCIQIKYNQWNTISQLSLRIFKDNFVTNYIQATQDEYKLKMAKDSYQGGYTQAFFIGQTDANEQIFYYDYNSMYPAIMAALKVPNDLDKCQIYNQLLQLDRYNYANKYFLKDFDPLMLDKNQYQFKVENHHFDLFQIQKFKFKNTQAPLFGIKTKLNGTIYVMEYDYERDKDIVNQQLNVFGFQLQIAFDLDILEYVVSDKQMIFPKNTYTIDLFKTFDSFLYEQRSHYKKQGNTSMALCIKIFLNSLYGKFGENHHDIDFFVSKQEYDSEQFVDIMMKNIEAAQDFDSSKKSQILDLIDIQCFQLYDLNNRDLNINRVQIKNIPRLNQHVGSFTYLASLITAIGRTQIIQIITKINKNPLAIVYYADTDSLIVNKEAQQQMKKIMFHLLNESQLGCMKNEYPDKSQQDTSIQQLIVLNKKVYQYTVNNKIINKFKGCRNPDDNMLQQFIDQDGIYYQQQQRFKKHNASVTIIDFQMKFRIRLSRCIEQAGQNVKTIKLENKMNAIASFIMNNASTIGNVLGFAKSMLSRFTGGKQSKRQQRRMKMNNKKVEQQDAMQLE